MEAEQKKCQNKRKKGKKATGSKPLSVYGMAYFPILDNLLRLEESIQIGNTRMIKNIIYTDGDVLLLQHCH